MINVCHESKIAGQRTTTAPWCRPKLLKLSEITTQMPLVPTKIFTEVRMCPTLAQMRPVPTAMLFQVFTMPVDVKKLSILQSRF